MPKIKTVTSNGRKFGVLNARRRKKKATKARIGAFRRSEIASARFSIALLLILVSSHSLRCQVEEVG